MSPAVMCKWIGTISEILAEEYERQMCIAVAFSNTELWLALMSDHLMLWFLKLLLPC